MKNHIADYESIRLTKANFWCNVLCAAIMCAVHGCSRVLTALLGIHSIFSALPEILLSIPLCMGVYMVLSGVFAGEKADYSRVIHCFRSWKNYRDALLISAIVKAAELPLDIANAIAKLPNKPQMAVLAVVLIVMLLYSAVSFFAHIGIQYRWAAATAVGQRPSPIKLSREVLRTALSYYFPLLGRSFMFMTASICAVFVGAMGMMMFIATVPVISYAVLAALVVGLMMAMNIYYIRLCCKYCGRCFDQRQYGE